MASSTLLRANPRTELKSRIRDAIGQGRLKPGDQIATVAAMAEAHSLSVPTVLKALRELSGEGLIETHRGKGVFVARTIRTRPRYGSLALIGYNESYWTSVLRPGHDLRFQAVLMQRCSALDMSLLFIPSGTTRSPYPDPERVVNAPIDGVLIHGAPPQALLQRLSEAGVPHVVMSREAERMGAPWVDYDHVSGIHAALGHLSGLGHRRVALVMRHFRGRSVSAALLDAFAERVRAAGADPERVTRVMDHDAAGEGEEAAYRFGIEAARSLMAQRLRVTGLIVVDPAVARGVVDGLLGAGVRVPDDVSVVLDRELSILPQPTHMTLPVAECVWQACLFLTGAIQAADGEWIAKPPSALIPRELSVGRSTGPVAAGSTAGGEQGQARASGAGRAGVKRQ